MNFIVSSSALLKRLTAIGGVIIANPIVPILANFLFEIHNGKLTVYSSDMQTTMITDLPVEAKGKFKIAIPAKMLTDTLKSLPELPLTFTIKDKNRIAISCDTGEYELAGEDAINFPIAPIVEIANHIQIKSRILLRAITSTIYSLSKEDSKPALQGLCINMSDSSVDFCATDGRRLSSYKITDIKCSYADKIIIPAKALNLLKSSLPDNDTIVKLEFNSSNAFFTYDNIKMICRLIDERFPDYENAIPTNNPNKLTINRTDFLNSLKRISIYANKTTRQVRLKIIDNTIEISAEDLDFESKCSEKISAEYEGSDIEIGLISPSLIDALNVLMSESICVTMSKPYSAVLLFPAEKKDENEDILMISMPVMLNVPA